MPQITVKINRMKLSLLLLALALSGPTPSGGQNLWYEKPKDAKPLAQLPSIQPIIQEIDAAVVNVSTSTEFKRESPQAEPGIPFDPFSSPEEFFERFFGGPGRQLPRRSMGSGFIISKDGYILTNNHVIEGADKVEVTVSRYAEKSRRIEQETYPAEIVGRDPRTDVALLKIQAKSDLPFAYLGNSDLLSKGDWVIAVGNPFGLDHSVSVGIVSALRREITPNENRRFDDFIQTDAAINFGNSGGPLVNMKGEVIGINTAITAQGSGIGFAIPINLAKEILPQLKEKGVVRRGYLGVMIQDITPEMRDALGLPKATGVMVSDVVQNGPASKSSLRQGDVILEIDGEPTPDGKSLQGIVARKQPGTKVNLHILRDKKSMKIVVELGALDEEAPVPAEDTQKEADRLGLVVGQDASGKVQVQEVDPNSPAFRSGILPGDRILQLTHKSKRYEIQSIQDYRQAIKDIKPGDSVLLSLQRQQGNQSVQLFVAFRLPNKIKKK